jgi:hypothetical protein
MLWLDGADALWIVLLIEVANKKDMLHGGTALGI